MLLIDTWAQLNEIVRAATEDQCRDMLMAEMNGLRRRAFLLRIHSRFNLLRAHRERSELDAVLKGTRSRRSIRWIK